MATDQNGTASSSYVKPQVRSVSEEEILEMMGPAKAYAGSVPFGF
jgi:hypothetical protein